MDMESFLRSVKDVKECSVSVNGEGRMVLHFGEESFIVFGDRTLNTKDVAVTPKPAPQGVVIDTGILAFGGMGER